MKLLLNDKEIAHFLYSLIDHHEVCNNIVFRETHTTEVVNWWISKADDKKFQKNIPKHKIKFKARLIKAIEEDLRTYTLEIKTLLNTRKAYYRKHLRTHIEYFINKIGEEKILNLYKNINEDYFVKSVGLHIDPTATLIRRKNFNSVTEDCLLRNTVGNEGLLVSKIDQNQPFWFIDSGYTNFIEPNKKWHRLVRNHLHSNKMFDAPVDRLGVFRSFPQPWREGGDRILVIEPGQFAAGIFHVDIAKWKYDVEAELRKYTDKKIVFREKTNKKTRANLYQHLRDEDYYCTVSINSNSATESIWAGVPAITLDKHVSNSVTRNKLADVNNLYTGSLASWLAVLSYSQFTYDELIDGTAVEIIRKYHV
jgi:hypothetical protein